MTRYIEVRYICETQGEGMFFENGGERSIEQIRDDRQGMLDAMNCGRHQILSVGEVDPKYADLSIRKALDREDFALDVEEEEEDEEEDYEPEYMYYEDDNQSEYWDDLYANDDPYLPYGDEDQ